MTVLVLIALTAGSGGGNAAAVQRLPSMEICERVAASVGAKKFDLKYAYTSSYTIAYTCTAE